MKAMQKLDEAREKLAEANKDFDNVRRKAKQAKMNFERVKQVQNTKFLQFHNSFFTFICRRDTICL